MLSYKCKIQSNITDKEIVLSDFFISSDLSILSGTTDSTDNISINDTFWIYSSYVPKKELANIKSIVKVRRNGYILVPLTLTINALFYNTTDEINKKLYYVEYNGNIYYNDISVSDKLVFDINGDNVSVSVGSSSIEIYDKIYIENKKVIVDGITYNVIINDDIIFSDENGEFFETPSDWVLTHIDTSFKNVYKIVIQNNVTEDILINNISRFGYTPFINYNGERMEFESLTDNDGFFEGYGVKIDGVNYLFTTLPESGSPSNALDVSNPNNYNTLEAEGEAGLCINGVAYKVYYDPKENENGDFICIETSKPDLPILMYDIITLKSINITSEVKVNEFSGVSYVFINNERYNKIDNLCDTVIINSVNYDLNYIGDSSNPYIGMFATVTFDDGTIQYFKVISLNSNGKVNKLCKLKYNNGTWEESYTMVPNPVSGLDNDTIKSKANLYTVNNNDGFLINGIKYAIEQESRYGNDGTVLETYDIIKVNVPIEYDLKVLNVIGNNKFICQPDLDELAINDDDLSMLQTDIYGQIVNNPNFVVRRNISTFGNKKYYVNKWISELLAANKSASILTLSQAENKIKLYRNASNLTLPINLSKSLNNSLSKDDLILDYYYQDKEESAINKIVDMEKDIYRPIYYVNKVATPIEKVRFNLHFRTRDLETWKIIQNQGEDSLGNNISADNLFSNWFVTDYYPYNQYSVADSSVYHDNDFLDSVMSQSDLLGLLYFTTNDVQVKRKKLSESFLRLTYYDSRDPNNQNMLGTSTIFFDCDKYFNILTQSHENVYYHTVAKSICNKWSDKVNGEAFDVTENQSPTVLMEAFSAITNETGKVSDMLFDESYRLSSNLVVSDRYTTTTSSEGFYPYILKAFGSKTKTQRIYLKIEFFHAGIGVKIPFVFATDSNMNAIRKWDNSNLETFKEGYSNSEIHKRQYIPIDISYSTNLREFVYTIASDNNYSNAIINGNEFVFNLFELKTKVK